jgi:SAM-dependent MidA family methyltransferase
MPPLTEIIRAEIAATGPMPFHRYMELALYHPEHGYYAGGKARIGRRGDYFTSVSVGPLFGALLAQQFLEVWERLGRPVPFELIEQGAHDGTLAGDILAALPGACAARLTIVEPFAPWRARQAAKLAGHPVRWVADVGELEPFNGVYYANELLDAFPVHRYRRTEAGWREGAVVWEGGRFVLVDLPTCGALAGSEFDHLPVGAWVEVNFAARQWVQQLASKLTRGAALIIDYGFPWDEYYAPARAGGTLEALANHRRVDPLEAPGEADLTAHVEFTTLACAAEEAGLWVAGFADQHHFLSALAPRYFREGVPPEAKAMRAFQTLAHPTMLGRAFQALALTRGLGAAPLAGFALARAPRAALGLL